MEKTWTIEITWTDGEVTTIEGYATKEKDDMVKFINESLHYVAKLEVKEGN